MSYNSRKSDYRRRMMRRRRRALARRLPLLALAILGAAVIGCGFFVIKRQLSAGSAQAAGTVLADSENGTAPSGSAPGSPSAQPETGTGTPDSSEETGTSAESKGSEEADALLEEAARTAAGYDYDAAIEMLSASPFMETDPRFREAADEYEATRASLVPYDINQVTHVFFHSLVIDEAKAFDGDADESGYNQVMTTRDEFLKILQSMYDKGFVLVRLHDLASETVDEDGNVRMEAGTILLPEGKKAFVMSQDDVCYYEYMDGDGFASRMVIGEDGKPTCEMKMDNGTVATGAYDLVPILEEFIQEHPDFSYRGARAVLAFTGYQGILGYRTAASYSDSPTYEQDREAAAAVAQCLRDNGWELASHSWGHRDLGAIEYSHFKTDCDKWESEVESLIGPTDIILFPFGADVGDWHPYSSDNDRFNYLYSLGFRYFCNVDSSQYWVQLGRTSLRQGRRNLDGYRMWQDIAAGDNSEKRRLDDLFRAEDVFSPNRPTPVTWD